MTQFLTTIIPPGADDKNGGYVKVDFVSPKGPKVDPLKVPLQPNTEKLANLDITLHNSFTKAFKMPAEYNGWFSKCFGYEVVLAYLGENLRGVLFEDLKPSKGNIVLNTRKSEPYGITFADCAPYLVVSKTSLGDVSARLPDGQEMDITKFRPNIVLEGAIEPWEEDYWGKLEIKGAELDLPHNCVRCRSINVDYTTGEQAPGDAGEVLKKLQKDRRVDKGAKWSPVFGRYSYWNPKHTARVLKAGDEVLVTKFNSERTTWSKCYVKLYMIKFLPNRYRLAWIIIVFISDLLSKCWSFERMGIKRTIYNKSKEHGHSPI
jgi:uncharacterized protein YcbX